MLKECGECYRRIDGSCANEPCFMFSRFVPIPEEKPVMINDEQLRDRFAGQAMMGILASGSRVEGKTEVFPDDIARISYNYADAMIRERNK